MQNDIIISVSKFRESLNLQKISLTGWEEQKFFQNHNDETFKNLVDRDVIQKDSSLIQFVNSVKSSNQSTANSIKSPHKRAAAKTNVHSHLLDYIFSLEIILLLKICKRNSEIQSHLIRYINQTCTRGPNWSIIPALVDRKGRDINNIWLLSQSHTHTHTNKSPPPTHRKIRLQKSEK